MAISGTEGKYIFYSFYNLLCNNKMSEQKHFSIQVRNVKMQYGKTFLSP